MKHSVLLIDDDHVACTMIGATLERAGLRVHVMSSPIGATRMIRDLSIDIVLCDLNMPAMRGDAFARLFRQSNLLKAVPLVVVSGAPQGELDVLLAAGTVDAVIHKADVESRLVRLITQLLRKRTE